MYLGIYIFCILLFEGLIASKNCPATDNESVLQPEHEYWYHFKTEAFGEAIGTTNDRSRMTLECTVHISHSHECFHHLKMNDCMLSAMGGPSDNEAAWIDKKELTDLSKFPIMFTLINGEIQDLYIDDSDPLFLVNIKRGALSAFVFKLSATKNNINEAHVDIHGTCPWYSTPVNGRNGYVKSSKDMMYCAYPSRPDWQFSPWSMFWNMSFIQYQINSTFDCEHKVNGDILENIYCKERHAIGLESTHRTTTAVQTNIYYHMTYEKSSKTKSKLTHKLPSKETSIVYEYDETPNPTKESESKNFLVKAQEMLFELVQTSQEEIHLSTVPKFTDFVAWIRTSYNLLPFIDSVKTCSFLEIHLTCNENIKELMMAYLSDALVQCNTVPCFEAISKLAIDGDLSDTYLNFVLYSWNNMHFTKAEIITHVKAICEAKDSKFCWLVLGKMIQNKRGNKDISLDPIKNVISHFHENIMQQCHSNYQSDVYEEDKYDTLLMNLKALANVGYVYTSFSSNGIPGIQELLHCVRKTSLPMPIRIAAVEVFSVCKDIPNDHYSGYDGCYQLYNILSNMFFDSSNDISLRLAIYDRLIEQPEMRLFMELPNIFQQENNTQILSYVATDLDNKLNDNLFKKKFPTFVHKIERYLDKHEIFLDSYMRYKEEKSKSEGYGDFFDIPFLPAKMQGFGAKFSESIKFPIYSILPQSFRTSTTIELFNKVIDLIQANVNVEGLNKFQPLLHEIFKEVHGRKFSWDLLKSIVTIIENYMTSINYDSENKFEEIYPFDKNVINNLRKLRNLIHQFKSPLKPSFNFYLDMFGSTLNIFTLKDFKNIKSWKESIPFFLNKLKDGMTYNNTRVIRIIEAYHQVPTMMGLPLNWTTNATLAFSSRKGLKLSFDNSPRGLELHGNGFFQPSIALTFLNRMVLDFPTITQIGVQANSSGYTSTQWKARLDYSDADNQRQFSIETPQKTQKILELFRTNQLIKHHEYDIPDWDIQRASTAWCSSKNFNSVSGFEICHERSYPNVTHLIKPWALMAGWCKWILEARLHDKNMKFYNFNLKMDNQESETKTKIIFNTPGSAYKREIILRIVHAKDSGHRTIRLNIGELPPFSIVLSDAKVFDSENEMGRKFTAELQLMDELKYKLIYNNENFVQKYSEETANKNKSPKPKQVATLTQETSVFIETPYNAYKYTRKMHFKDKNIKADIYILFENHNSKWNWLVSILPPTLWESNNKAWIRLHLNLQKPSPNILTWSIESPKSSIQLLSNSLSLPGRNQLNINLTKTDASNQLLSFANFTYDSWSSANENLGLKKVNVLNFTIPKRSWSFQENFVMESIDMGNAKTSYNGVFTIAQMNPKNGYIKNYVGWWSDDSKDNFDLIIQKYDLNAVIGIKLVDSSEIMEIVPSWPQSDNWDKKNRYIDVDVKFLYPSSYQDENITFNGYFIMRDTQFQKDFAFGCSYHNLKLDSHSIYRTENNQWMLTHRSFFTHAGSETKAFYNWDYKKVQHDYQELPSCYDIDFNHNISSHVLNFASNISYHCDYSASGLHNNLLNEVLTLNMDSSSNMWDMLNTQLRQRIEGTPENKYETMNFSHPLLNINVVAEWHGDETFKNATFTKTNNKSPTMIINYKKKSLTMSETVLNIFSPTHHKIMLRQNIANDIKKSNVIVSLEHEKNKIFKLQKEFINPHVEIWKYKEYSNATYYYDLLNNFKEAFVVMSTKIAEDPNHPLNKILKPALKMTIAEYWSTLKQYVVVKMFDIRKDVTYALMQLFPIYETPLQISVRIITTVTAKIKQFFKLIENKSISVWAFKYFQIPELLEHGVTYIDENVHELENKFLNSKLMEKLIEFASNQFSKQTPHHMKSYHRFTKSKIGMIFGSRHVRTFDGLVYEFPEYPSNDCMFLLAHDIYESRFTIMSTVDSIHILFPEMFVTIDGMGKIYINGTEPQSLPLQSQDKNIFIFKEDEILKVSSPYITVLCQTRNEFCTIELNAWNTGRTLGLLGNADGEKYNEYTLPDGSVQHDILEFARQYELTQKPECQQLKSVHYPLSNNKNRKHCHKELENACDSFSYVEENGFINACIFDLEERNDPCPTKAALSALCFLEDEIMSVKCNVKQQETEHIRHKLDVILVVDEHESTATNNKGIFLKGIESLLTAIETQFQTKGYSSIHYSLIGFGGNGVHFHPSVHSVKNDIWMPYKAATQDLLKTLNFDGVIRGNPINGLRYALETLGHDTFDSKLIIFITNEDHQVSSKEVIHIIENYLDKNSITLYTISSYPTIEKGKKVYGVRADGLMFPSAKNSETYLDYPRGDLAKLTSATKGSLFLKNFADENGPSNFFSEVAEEMWAKVRKEVKFCRKCTTVRRWWYYYNQCIISDCYN